MHPCNCLESSMDDYTWTNACVMSAERGIHLLIRSIEAQSIQLFTGLLPNDDASCIARYSKPLVVPFHRHHAG